MPILGNFGGIGAAGYGIQNFSGALPTITNYLFSRNSSNTITLATSSPEDLVIFIVSNTATTSISSSGWTVLSESSILSPEYIIAYKVMSSTPDTSISLTSSGLYKLSASIVISNQNSTGPFDGNITVRSVPASTYSVGLPSIVTTMSRELVLAIGIVGTNTTSTSPVSPSGYTDLGYISGYGTANWTGGIVCAYKNLEVAEVLPEDSFDNSNSGSGGQTNFGFKLAIKG